MIARPESWMLPSLALLCFCACVVTLVVLAQNSFTIPQKGQYIAR